MSAIPFHELARFGLAGPLPGVLDDEGGDAMLGPQGVSTTKPGTTVFSRVVGVPTERMVALTRAVEEIEFLAADRRVGREVLVDKVNEVWRRLRGTSRWPGAGPGWDSHDALVARLQLIR